MAYTAFRRYRQQTAEADMDLNPYKTIPPIRSPSPNKTETQRDNDDEGKNKEEENHEDKEVDEDEKDKEKKEDTEAGQNKGDQSDDGNDDDALDCDELYEKSMGRMSKENFSLGDAVEEMKKHLALLSTSLEKKEFASRVREEITTLRN